MSSVGLLDGSCQELGLDLLDKQLLLSWEEGGKLGGGVVVVGVGAQNRSVSHSVSM